jgi:hypothetical protein
MKKISFLMMLLCVLFGATEVMAQTPESAPSNVRAVAEGVVTGDRMENFFDDKLLIEGYAKKLGNASKEVLLAMTDDNSLYAYKKAAAIRVFREMFAADVVLRERVVIERALLRQLELARSVFLQVEIMHTLLILDRYRFFDGMIPALIKKLDHYDVSLTDMAFKAVDQVVTMGTPRSREARIVFNTLRKMFFLSRKKLQDADVNDTRLKNKLSLLRWSVKVLGTQELKNLPKEVIGLM